VSKQTYVRNYFYTAYDWHDMATIATQLEQNGKYEIDNPIDAIAQDIFDNIKQYIEPLTLERVKEAILKKDKVTLSVTVPERIEVDDHHYEVNPYEIDILSINPRKIRYQLAFSGGYTAESTYYVDEIEKDRVSYLVSEHIVSPRKGCDLLERIYHELFDSEVEATAYLEEQKRHYKNPSYHGANGYKLMVVDGVKMKKDSWYEKNLLAQDYIERLNEDPKKYRLYDAYSVIQELQPRIDEFAKEKDGFEDPGK